RRGPRARREVLVRPPDPDEPPAREAHFARLLGKADRVRAHALPHSRPPRPTGADPGALSGAPLYVPASLDRARADGPGGIGLEGAHALSVACRRRNGAHPRIPSGSPRAPQRRRPRTAAGSPGVKASRLGQGFSLARDWIAPGEALAQWTHFITSVCNARCAHCFYPINAAKQDLTLEEIDRLAQSLPPIR